MSFEWKHDGVWEHAVRLKTGETLSPNRIVMDSATRDSNGSVVPCVFLETNGPDGIAMRWVRWDDIESVCSTMVRKEAQ